MKLWPLIKRWGFFCGFLIWLKCKYVGHDWHNVGEIYAERSRDYDNGFRLVKGKVKMRCSRCESAKLIPAEFVYAPDGTLIDASTPNGYIEII